MTWANQCIERLHELEPAAAMAHRRREIVGGCLISGAKITYSFPYSDEAVAIARTLPGARFDNRTKSWSFEPWSIADVDRLITGFNQIAGVAQSKRDQVQAQMKAEVVRQDRREAAIRQIERTGEKSAADPTPIGETIWETGSFLRAKRLVVLTEDGWLWLMITTRRFSSNVGQPNQSEAMRGYRITATPELIDAIRA